MSQHPPIPPTPGQNPPPPPTGVTAPGYSNIPLPDAAQGGYQAYQGNPPSPYPAPVAGQYQDPGATAAIGAGHFDVLTAEQKRKAQKSEGAVAMTIAVLAHVVILFILLYWFLPSPPEKLPELVVSTAGETSEPSVEKDEFVSKIQDRPSSPSSSPNNVIASAAAAPMAIPTVDIEVDTPSLGTSFGTGFGTGGFGDGFGGGLSVPATMKGRCDAADRLKRLRQSGGSASDDKAVIKALQWFKAKQNSDGSWGSTHQVALTGLVLLAYSGHCETVDSVEFGETVKNAIEYLVTKGESSKGMMETGKPGYEHAIATYALGEAYTLNKNARKKFKPISPVLKDAVKIITDGQTKDGGWLYRYGQGAGGDLSVAGWNIQALKAAELTGRSFSGLGGVKAKVRRYLKDSAHPSGAYLYRSTGNQRPKGSLTGVGLLCSVMMDADIPHEKAAYENILEKQKPNNKNKVPDSYAWYYHSQACMLKGAESKEWREYNREFQKIVASTQSKDGSWQGLTGHAGNLAENDKVIYHTALCTLMLEVYYRYLPSTDLKK